MCGYEDTSPVLRCFCLLARTECMRAENRLSWQCRIVVFLGEVVSSTTIDSVMNHLKKAVFYNSSCYTTIVISSKRLERDSVRLLSLIKFDYDVKNVFSQSDGKSNKTSTLLPSSLSREDFEWLRQASLTMV